MFILISHYYTIVFERYNVLLSQPADPGLCKGGTNFGEGSGQLKLADSQYY